jgi:hypothetical protein
MASIIPLRPQALWPDDLRVAADAFEEALEHLPTEAYDLKPYTARQLLARYIVDAALSGIGDAAALRDGAIEYVSRAAAKQAAA